MAAPDSRARRRRGAGKRAVGLQSSISPMRAPLGTAVRPSSNTQFSHIQIIPKVSPENSNAEGGPPQPTFRQPSLAQEAEAALAGSLSRSMLSTTDSLANNTLGTTFAAKARAAELQAARARKRLKENDNTMGDSSSSGAYEVLTFTKTRAREGRAWKPWDVHDGVEEQDGESQDSVYHLPTELTKLGDVQLNVDTSSKEYEDDQLTASTVSSAAHSRQDSYQQQRSAVARASSRTQMSPIPEPQDHQSRESYFTTHFKPAPPRTEDGQAGIASSVLTRSLNEKARTTSCTLFPLPVLTSPSEEVQKNAEYLTRKQATLLQYLDNATRDPNPEHGRLLHAEGSVFEDYDLNPTLRYDNVRGAETDMPDRTFTASPTADSSISQQHSSDHNYQPMTHGFSLSARGPRPISQYQYPAVKGTMINNLRPSLERRISHEPFAQQLQNYPPIGQNAQHYPLAPLNYGPQSPHRKHSSTETKGTMLQHLYGVVDHATSASPTSGALSSNGRTVLHDPLAHMKDYNTGFAPPEPVEDIFQSSDPLPWKSRMVDIVRPPSHPESAAVDDKFPETTPFGIPAFHRGQAAREAELAEIERWWSAPARAYNLRKQDNKENLTHTTGFNFNLGPAGRSYDHGHSYGSLHQFSDDTAVPSDEQVGDIADDLIFPVLKNLTCYLMPGGGFNRYSRVMDWCIDQSVNGRKSFFGEDWGQLPPRVGRDPRYKPIPHDGTRSVYEPLSGRWGIDTYSRRYPVR